MLTGLCATRARCAPSLSRAGSVVPSAFPAQNLGTTYLANYLKSLKRMEVIRPSPALGNADISRTIVEFLAPNKGPGGGSKLWDLPMAAARPPCTC
jgi:hypothetical protein